VHALQALGYHTRQSKGRLHLQAFCDGAHASQACGTKQLHDLLRERQHTKTFKELYKRRAGIEGTMSQAAYALGMRRTRYRGIKKTHLHHIAIATAINLQRCMDWLWEVSRAKTYISHFARLALAA
jgi:hypothetical protein